MPPPWWPPAFIWFAAFSLCSIPTVQTVIAWIGGFTALLAALIAIQQNDIKRILAYSTLSQLGYMVMAAGLSNRMLDATYQPAAIFHLATHACFKALLFLGAGSVIHALSHEQDIWKMGRLRDKMPVTALTFLIGTLALCGLFAIKRILQQGRHSGRRLQRKPGLVWHRRGGRGSDHLLYVPAGLRGVLGQGKIRPPGPRPRVAAADDLSADRAGHRLGGRRRFGHSAVLEPQFFVAQAHASSWPWWLNPFLPHAPGLGFLHQMMEGMLEPFRSALVPALCGLGAFLFGFLAALGLYANADSDPLPKSLPGLCRLLRNKFYFDELYAVADRHHPGLGGPVCRLV